MSEIIHTMTDNAIKIMVGDFIKNKRIEQRKSQQDVALQSGLSRATVSLIERGNNVAFESIIKVMRVLDLLYLFEQFKYEPKISPIAMAKLEAKKVKRIRK